MRRLIPFLALLLFLPAAEAVPSITTNNDGTKTYFDDFTGREGPTDFGTLEAGTTTGTQSTVGKYSTTSNGAGFASYMDTTTNSWVVQAATGSAAFHAGYLGHTASGAESIWAPCELGGANGFSVSWKTKLIQAPTANENFRIALNSAGASNSADQTGITYGYNTGTSSYTVTPNAVTSLGSATGPGLTGILLGATVTTTITGIDCASTNSFVTITDGTTTVANSLDPAGTWTGTDLAGLLAYATTSSGGIWQIDDITVRTPSVVVGNDYWCSAQGNDEFGYDRAEGVVLDTSTTGTDGQSIEPSYRFEGDETSSTWDYLAKSWTGGDVTQVETFFYVESAADGDDSVFRVSFSPVSGVPDGLAGTEGNLEDTGHFVQHVEVRFKETGNNWNIQVYHVSAVDGVTTRTALGAASVQSGANSPTFYGFEVNTELRRVYVQRGGEDILFEGGLPGVILPSYWQDREFLNMYYLGYGGAGTLTEATTYLDTGETAALSTCIRFHSDTVTVAGDLGRAEPALESTEVNVTGPEPDDTTGEDVGLEGPAQNSGNPLGNMVAFLSESWGFDWSWLIGFIALMVVFVPVLVMTRGSPLAGGVVLVGFTVGNVKLGLWEEWTILLMIFAVAALAGNRIFNRQENDIA